MPSGIGSLLQKTLGNSAARVLTGAGLSVASYGAITVAISTALSALTSSFSALPSAMLNIILLAGVGQAISIIGAAMLTRAAINSATVGLTKT